MPPKKTVAPAVEDIKMEEAPAAASPAPESVDGGLGDFSEQRIKIVSFLALFICTAEMREGMSWFANVFFVCIQLDGSSETAASFQFAKEDHTLGNALRYIIMKK